MPGRPRRPVVSRSMRSYAALLAVVLAIPASAAAQAPAAPASAGAEAAQPSTAPPPAADESSRALARIKRRLNTDTPLRDAAEQVPEAPTFRTSVTEHVDIWKFWGEPEDVAAFVRPSGGTWHNEFQAMVTPDEFRNAAGLGSAEQLQLAATSLAFAGAMKLLGIGVQQMKQGAHNRTVRKAKEEVQRELEAFYAAAPRGTARGRPDAAVAVRLARRAPRHPGGNSARSTSGARRAQSASECWPPATSR